MEKIFVEPTACFNLIFCKAENKQNANGYAGYCTKSKNHTHQQYNENKITESRNKFLRSGGIIHSKQVWQVHFFLLPTYGAYLLIFY
ncbi:MAG: hypothetical protein C4308_10125 [Chitinophagaceae bacterium]